MWHPQVYVRYVALPAAVGGVTVPNPDGSFDIYINSLQSPERQASRLAHEIRHIMLDHFYDDLLPVASLEQEAKRERGASRC